MAFFNINYCTIQKDIRILQKALINMFSIRKPKVFITRNDYPKIGIELLKEKCDIEEWDITKGDITRKDLLSKIKDKDAVFIKLGDIVNKEFLDSAGKNLKVIGTMSVGVDHVDLKAVKESGVKLGYTPDVLTEAVAELTMGLLLATSRRLFEAHTEMITGGWKDWAPLWMCGQGLDGASVGIVGFGRIGQSVAHKLTTFNVAKILYSSKQEKPRGVELGAERTSLDELLSKSDFVIVTTALTEQTKGMFNKDKFCMMKPSCIFINVSRGGVVVQEDLVEALKSKTIAAAGLDVMTPEPLPLDHPLHSLPNCVLLPHIGSATYQARNMMSKITAENILAALENKKMPAEHPLI